MWMLLVLFYGLAKGGREIVKKKAMEKSTVMEVLLFYTLLSFVMVIPEIGEAGGMERRFYFWVALKSFLIFIAWICSFKALKKLPLSLYGILDLSRVLFSTLLGVVVLNEVLLGNQIIGLVLVSLGLIMLKCKPKVLRKIFKLDEYSEEKNELKELEEIKEIKKSGLEKGEDFIKEESKENIKENIKEEIIEIENKSKSNVADGIKKNNKEHKIYIYVIAAFISCMFNAMSGLMDKILTKDITSSQLQFWYMLFLLLYYVIYCIVTREKVSVKTFKNGWVWILALLFVLADRALFIANGDVNSKVTVMTMIKQSSCIVTILGGKFVFKEKHVGYKILCAVIVVAGIIIAVL